MESIKDFLLESTQKTFGTNENFSTNIQNAETLDLIAFKVGKTIIPYTFYQINENNNQVTWSEDAVTTTAKIPPGNYTDAQLITSIQGIMSGLSPNLFTYTFSVNASTKKTTLSHSFSGGPLVGYDNTSEQSILRIFGFEQILFAQLLNTARISKYAFSEIYTDYLLLHSNALSGFATNCTFLLKKPKVEQGQGKAKCSSVIAQIPINGPFWSTLVWEPPNNDFIALNPDNRISSVDLYLTDKFFNEINLNDDPQNPRKGWSAQIVFKENV